MESADLLWKNVLNEAYGNYVQPMIDVTLNSYSSIRVASDLVVGCILLDCSSLWLRAFQMNRNFYAYPEAAFSMLMQEFMESSTAKVTLFTIIFLAPYLPLMWSDNSDAEAVEKANRKPCVEPIEELHGEMGSWTMINTNHSPLKVDSKSNESNEDDVTPPVRSSTNCAAKSTNDICQDLQNLQNLHDLDADHPDCERDSATNDDVQTIDYSQDLEYEHGGRGGTVYGCVYVDEVDVRNGRSTVRLQGRSLGDGSIGSNSSTGNSNESYDRIMQQSIADPRVLVGWQVAIQGYGVGVILGTVKRKFSTTRFSVELESGEVVQLALQRGKHKGSVPFTLLQKLN